MKNITILYIEKTRSEAEILVKCVKEALPGLYPAAASAIRLPEDKPVLICTYSTDEALSIILQKQFNVDLVIMELENERQIVEWERIDVIRKALGHKNTPLWVYTHLRHYRKKCMQEYGIQFLFEKNATAELVVQLKKICTDESQEAAYLELPMRIYPERKMLVKDILCIRIERGVHHIYYVNASGDIAHHLSCETFLAHNIMLQMMENGQGSEMIRISRTCMVNGNYIKAMKGSGEKMYLLLYQMGAEKLYISYESYLKGVKEYLGEK